MLIGLAVIVAIGGLFITLERLYPAHPLPVVQGWWKRIVLINAWQLFTVVLGMHTWEKWLPEARMFNLQEHVSPPVGGLIAYLAATWIFYWFHVCRHVIYVLWCHLHQLHHSISRLETVSSFYKDPKEILVDALILATLLRPILGLSSESSIWLSGFSSAAENLYHANIHTPRWLGYFLQRPEMHYQHHLANRRAQSCNYGDIVLWDYLGGTYYNPITYQGECGFNADRECQVYDMLLGRDVLLPKTMTPRNSNRRRYSIATVGALALLSVGFLQSAAFMFKWDHLRGAAFASVASPLPLVFSVYNGVETFSTSFHVTAYGWADNTKSTQCQPWPEFGVCTSASSIQRTESVLVDTMLTPQLYSRLKVPYNLRNAYGVLLSHGPLFTDPRMIRLRDKALERALCDPNSPLLAAFHLEHQHLTHAIITVTSNAQQTNGQQWVLQPTCV